MTDRYVARYTDELLAHVLNTETGRVAIFASLTSARSAADLLNRHIHPELTWIEAK